MIKKFIEIKNIGKFKNCTPSGDVELKKVNVICAGNGMGKTTICDILRSVKTGNPEYIIGRKTLGISDSQIVNIRLENSNAVFINGNWNYPLSHIEIFDLTFIHGNIYAGDCVEHDHKKNLYKVIVGEKGVTLALKVDELDGKIRDYNRAVSSYKTNILKIVPSGYSFEDYLSLTDLPDLDRNLKDKENELDVLSKMDEILRKEALQKISCPEFPADFQRIISKSIEGVSTDAEKVVKEHIEKHTNNATKEWVFFGLEYTKDNNCPFCAQSVATAEIISVYKAYFSQSYSQLKTEIGKLKSEFLSVHREPVFLTSYKTAINNDLLCEYWKQYIKFEKPVIDVSAALETLKALAGIIQDYILDKEKAPFDQIKLGDDFWDKQKKVEELKDEIARYNSSVEEVNTRIAVKKNELRIADSSKIKNDIEMLKVRKRRLEPGINELCDAYLKTNEAKRQLDSEKVKVKTELDNYADNIFINYEAKINKLLENFGAGFRITETKRSYLGGTASSQYQIKINNVAVDLGDSSSPVNIPSFRNTLSAGDRNTLALAFFIAQLENDANLANKIVVLDDPFSSLDRSRRTCTKQIICGLSQKAKQVIVLSHDPRFLKIIWDDSDKGTIKPLQLCRLGDHSTITEWDIEKETREEYHQNYSILVDYCNNGIGDRKKVAMTIRPLLEQNFRFHFPGQFGDNEWLGDFIKKIREAQGSSPLVSAQGILNEIDAVNDYSKKYHHNTNSADETESIDDAELSSYSKRALGLVGGF